MTAKVTVISVGAVSAFGPHTSDFLTGIRSKRCACREIVGFEAPPESPGIGAELRDFQIGAFIPSIKSYVDRCTALALKAGLDALSAPAVVARRAAKVGLCFGSEFACLETMNLYCSTGLDKGWRFAPPFLFIHSYANTPAAEMHIDLGMKGFSNVFSGGPNAGWEAVSDAIAVLGRGQAGMLLTGASEALGPSRYKYYHGAGNLGTVDKPNQAFIPGEGAAFLLLCGPDSVEEALALSGASEPLGQIEICPSEESQCEKSSFVFRSTPDGLSPAENDGKQERIDLRSLTGMCGAADVPLAIAAFFGNDEYPRGSSALFPPPLPGFGAALSATKT
ncbi:MAG: beta-ketoacyl synthase N-terminal-like domain-containing protein [Candidatus Brocadiia bacterium]